MKKNVLRNVTYTDKKNSENVPFRNMQLDTFTEMERSVLRTKSFHLQ